MILARNKLLSLCLFLISIFTVFLTLPSFIHVSPFSPFVSSFFTLVRQTILLRPERICLVVCRLFSTLASSPRPGCVYFILLSLSLSLDFLFCRCTIPPVFRPSLTTSVLQRLLYVRYELAECLPCWESSSSSSSSRSTSRVAAGFPRTPVLTFPLISTRIPGARRRETRQITKF